MTLKANGRKSEILSTILREYTFSEAKGKYCIYLLVSPIGKCYVGQTKNLNRRFKCYERLHCKQQRLLYNALNKYGFENFICKIIDICSDQNEADKKEIMYIQNFGSMNNKYGYNLQSGGHNGSPSLETKNKIRNTLLGPNLSRGVSRTKEVKLKISKSLVGRIFSEAHRKNFSISLNKTLKYRKTKYLYVLRNPSNQIIYVKRIGSFCRKRKLDEKKLYAVLRGDRSHSLGWVLLRKIKMTNKNKNLAIDKNLYPN